MSKRRQKNNYRFFFYGRNKKTGKIYKMARIGRKIPTFMKKAELISLSESTYKLVTSSGQKIAPKGAYWYKSVSQSLGETIEYGVLITEEELSQFTVLDIYEDAIAPLAVLDKIWSGVKDPQRFYNETAQCAYLVDKQGYKMY